MFRFENLAAFNYLWLIPALIIIGIIFDRLARKKMESALGSRLYPFLSSSVSKRKRQLKTVLQTLAVLFFVISLARPQAGQSLQQVKSEGVEVLFAVDVSESMLAEDVRPNRLEQAKAELNRLLDLMPGNKVGVIAFAGSAHLLSPLSSDPGAVKMYIDSLQPNSVSSQGTNIEAALKVAEEAFERGGVSTDDSTKVTRVILFASDGEDQEPGAMKAAENLVKKDIRIFSIAYGTEKGGAIPVHDGMGFLKGYKKDRKGNTVLTTVKGDTLRDLAQAGKGSFYYASFGGDHLKHIVEDFSKLERSEFENSVATQYEERYQLFLLMAILIALFEIFLGERRSTFRFWKGRYEVPPV